VRGLFETDLVLGVTRDWGRGGAAARLPPPIQIAVETPSDKEDPSTCLVSSTVRDGSDGFDPEHFMWDLWWTKWHWASLCF
jgi:hypothetical protein